jgi:hypothetical protein
MRERRNVHRILVRKTDRKRPLSRPKHVWEEYTELNQRNRFSWYHVVQNRDQWRALVNTVIKPSGSTKCGKVSS